MRAAALLTALVALALVAGCGGSDRGEPVPAAPAAAPAAAPPPAAPAVPAPPGAAPTGAPAEPPPAAGSLQDRLDATPGPDLPLALGVGDLAVGESRLSFQLIDDQGEPIEAPAARVLVGRVDTLVGRVDASSISFRPTAEADAALVPLGRAADGVDAGSIYVATVPFAEAGAYWVLLEPAGLDAQGYAVVEVAEAPRAPAVGTRAIASDTPTVADAPAEAISTARPVDAELLQVSVADALAAGEPLVVAFATPRFCKTRACGPVVEVVRAAARELAGRGVRFVHVEIYERNDPANGENRWVREWGLPSEPWVFVVDGEGVIRARFEGALGLDELVAAVRTVVPGGS
ncbi:MAG: hypothetical protein R3C15_22815 [Thermoleophilia bacterium]